MIKKWLESKIYSKRTNNILNHFTLQISDAHIDRRYRIERSKHFNKIWKVSLVICVIYFIRHIILKTTDPNENYN